MNLGEYKFGCALLIDDDSTDSFINKRILELSLFARKIIVKNSCREGLAYLQEECADYNNIPDVIFLDFFMPVQGGTEFLDSFEKLSPRISLKSKVVMLSVLDNELHPGVYDQNRVFGAIVKPLTDDKIEWIFSPEFAFSFLRNPKN